jgi:hypothetical protein
MQPPQADTQIEGAHRAARDGHVLGALYWPHRS